MRHIIFITFTLCTLGCKKQEDSQAKFIALAQTHKENIKSLLINKVHKPEWKIHYGFADNNGCGGKFSPDAARAQLTTTITEALQTWLQALQHRGNIVQNFSYELDDNKYIGLLGVIQYRNSKFDLAIIFYCQEGRSFARLSKSPIELHIYHKMKNYQKSTLLHEVGHAFGLDDTYVDGNENVGRYNTSDGGSDDTVGIQPLSVMNESYLMSFDPYSLELILGEDDHVGINWLYDFHHSKDIGKDSCPLDYIYEPNTQGCAPRYPLIFAVKQARVEIVEKLLQEDADIDLNQQDSLGNTALHYAANLAGLHGRGMYNFLLKHGAKDTLKNKNNKTAPEILAVAGKNSKFIATMFAAVRRVREGKTQEIVMINLVQEFRADKSNDINMQDTVGNTLLHYAAIHGKIDLLNILRGRNDLDVNAQARLNKETALHKAARYGHEEFAMWLIAYYRGKIDISIKDAWGKTALDRALYEEQQARSEGKAQLADKFKRVAEVIRELDLRRVNKKQQSL